LSHNTTGYIPLSHKDFDLGNSKVNRINISNYYYYYYHYYCWAVI